MKNLANSSVIKLLALTVLTAFCILIVPLNISAQWEKLQTGHNYSYNDIAFTSPVKGYIVGDSGLILSTVDSGTSWKKVKSETSLKLLKVCFPSKEVGYIGGDSGRILKTVNNGESWEKIATGTTLPIKALYFINDSTGFASANFSNRGTMLKTMDGGNTWEEFNLVDVAAQGSSSAITDIQFPSLTTGYAVARNAVFKTIDAGITWFEKSRGSRPIDTLFSVLEACYFITEDIGFVGGWYSSILAGTNDGGEIWDKRLQKISIYDIDFPTNNTGYAVGEGRDGPTIFITENTGKEWEQEWADTNAVKGTSMVAVSMPEEHVGFAISVEKGALYRKRPGLVGIKKDLFPQQFNLSIYPNPFINEIYIKGTRRNEEVVLLDITGKEILRQKTTDYETKINSAHISPGFYLLSYKEGNRSENIKLIKL